MNFPLLQLGDSALPIGGYSHSWGLEGAIDRQVVRDPATLEQWARWWLGHALAPFEGVIVAAVCRALTRQDWPLIRRANQLLWAGMAPPTLRHASREMGEQLLALAETWPWAQPAVLRLRELQEGPLLHPGAANPAASPASGARLTDSWFRPWHHAVVFGALAAAAGSVPVEALGVYLHQAALGMIGAGVRAIPIGHTHGQQILALLHGDLYNLSEEMAGRDLETAGSSCPAYEVFCHEQTRLYTRIFRS